jgi:hypothetical protein
MTASWSGSPFERAAPLSSLGPTGRNLSENNGESRRVCRLNNHPGWLFKEYRRPAAPHDVSRLTKLIELPENIGEDLSVVDANTAWPTSRVLDHDDRTIGVVMPEAPERYVASLTPLKGRLVRKSLLIDLLADSQSAQMKLGLPGQGVNERLEVCASVTTVGSLLERYGLVYLDWSYANVFWSIGDHSAFVIDIDGCSFGQREQIGSPNWEDPQVPQGRLAGNEVDRYRIALLAARCLTGERSVESARNALIELSMKQSWVAPVTDLLVRSLFAKTKEMRPSISDLDMAMKMALGFRGDVDLNNDVLTLGGVTGWKAIGRDSIAASGSGSEPAATPMSVPPPYASNQSVTATSAAPIHTVQWPQPDVNLRPTRSLHATSYLFAAAVVAFIWLTTYFFT